MRSVVVAGAVLAFCASAEAKDLSGLWTGTYGYDAATPRNVNFTAKLRFEDDDFSGTTSEPNTFGAKSAKRLTASIVGIVGPSGAVNFTKTYDGSGGVSHSVDYAGYLEANGRCISGNWHIGDTGGPFRMCRGSRLVS